MIRYKFKLFGVHTSIDTVSKPEAFMLYEYLVKLFKAENVEMLKVRLN